MFSTELHYTDLGGKVSDQLPSSDNIEFVIPLKQVLSYAEVYESKVTRNESGLIKLLPDEDPCNLRPHKLTTIERPLESNISCDNSMGHQCSLVSQMKAIINSEVVHEILLWLFRHQMIEATDTQQKTSIANLREFDNIRCLREQKTGYFDNSGKLRGKERYERYDKMCY
jgi:hypothetical protein